MVLCSAIAISAGVVHADYDVHAHVPTASEVHYSYGREYNYHEPSGYGYDNHIPSYGYQAPSYENSGYNHHEYNSYDHKHGYSHGSAHKEGYSNNVYNTYQPGHDYGYGYEPQQHGYVPVHGGPYDNRDQRHGYAYGHDAVGPFDHHTGPFGPFGFYANFYHDLHWKNYCDINRVFMRNNRFKTV